MEVLKNTKFRRIDNHGSGAFGASRGSRTHIGVDLIANPGTYVYAPFSGKISKYGYAYPDDLSYRYIEITGNEFRVRLFYSELDDAHFLGKTISEGQFLGIAQDIAARYTGITPHIHFELYDLDGNIIDPTEMLKKKV